MDRILPTSCQLASFTAFVPTVDPSPTEETARTRRFPGIAFRGDDARRRAWVIGSGLDVWEIIQMLEDFGSADALVAETQLTPAHGQAFP